LRTATESKRPRRLNEVPGVQISENAIDQFAAQIRRAIADGEAKPGERLLPAKDLGAVLGVNTNTVLRSLRLPRDEG